MEGTILIVDDVPANQNLLRQTLAPRGFEILLASDGEMAIDLARRASPDLILLDILMPGLDGYETCRRLKAAKATSQIPVIFITAQPETSSLVEGFRAGGVDYITKPFQADEVLVRVETHLKINQLTRALQCKNTELEAEIARRERAENALATADEQLSLISNREAERWGLTAFVGRSRTLEKILADIRNLQQAGSISVLITGESGTGKELVARAIHFGGPRAKATFLPVNCAAIPKDLAESLFFGHVRGAFSGANTDQKGYFELAHGGTLFLDEIGEMPVVLQAKLLRVLEDGRVRFDAATKDRQVVVRIVAASNADFTKKIATGEFRQDLYHRLARFTVVVPPLRERPEDISLLAAHFLKLFASEMGRPPPPLRETALVLLRSHPFFGNVRELKNVVERALIESHGGEIGSQHLHLASSPVATAGLMDEPSCKRELTTLVASLPLNLEAAELALIKRALAQTGGNISKAADLLGVNRARIYRALGQANESEITS